MDRGPKIIVGILLVFTLLVGVVAGGVVGGGVGYIVANRAKPVSAAAAQPVQAAPVSSVSKSQTAPVAASDATVVGVVKQVSPAVVTVVNTLRADAVPNQQQQSPFQDPQSPQNPQQQTPRATGSGVIISKDGYLITNNHVVEGEASLAVYFADGTRHEATLVGTDPLMDVAVVKVKDVVPAFVPLANSDDIQPGETAIAIGSPLGDFRNSVTVGVVSAKNRSVGSMEGLIQTDAAINHGNSGGPLLNLQGQVIGINTLVVRGTGSTSDQAEGLGFSVPSNTVKQVSDQLIATGKVVYPYLGVSYSMIDPETAADENLPVQNGALVGKGQQNNPAVQPNTPAAKAGIEDGDIITAIDGAKLGVDSSLRQILLKHKPGDTIKLDVLRAGKTLTLDVTLSARPNDLQQ